MVHTSEVGGAFLRPRRAFGLETAGETKWDGVVLFASRGRMSAKGNSGGMVAGPGAAGVTETIGRDRPPEGGVVLLCDRVPGKLGTVPDGKTRNSFGGFKLS